MRTRALRLNDILVEGETLVDFGYPYIENFTQNNQLKQIMYDSVINNYLWAFVNADNEEQFKSWFRTYWNRLIIQYLPNFENQIIISHNLNQARIEEHENTEDKTETPNLVDKTSYKLGDKTETTYGRKLDMKSTGSQKNSNTQTNDLTTTDKGSTDKSATTDRTDKQQIYQYDTVISNTETKTDETVTENDTNKNTRKETGTIKNSGTTTNNSTGSNTYSGVDKVERSGENVQTLTRSGNRVFSFKQKGTDKITYYDLDRFIKIIKHSNILNAFIDEFSPLFSSILFYE